MSIVPVHTLELLTFDPAHQPTMLLAYKKRRKARLTSPYSYTLLPGLTPPASNDQADKRFFQQLQKKFTVEDCQDDPRMPVYSREGIRLMRVMKKLAKK